MKPILSAEKEMILNLPDEQVRELIRRAKYAGPCTKSSTDREQAKGLDSAVNELNNLVGMAETKNKFHKLLA